MKMDWVRKPMSCSGTWHVPHLTPANRLAMFPPPNTHLPKAENEHNFNLWKSQDENFVIHHRFLKVGWANTTPFWIHIEWHLQSRVIQKVEVNINSDKPTFGLKKLPSDSLAFSLFKSGYQFRIHPLPPAERRWLSHDHVLLVAFWAKHGEEWVVRLWFNLPHNDAESCNGIIPDFRIQRPHNDARTPGDTGGIVDHITSHDRVSRRVLQRRKARVRCLRLRIERWVRGRTFVKHPGSSAVRWISIWLEFRFKICICFGSLPRLGIFNNCTIVKNSIPILLCPSRCRGRVSVSFGCVIKMARWLGCMATMVPMIKVHCPRFIYHLEQWSLIVVMNVNSLRSFWEDSPPLRTITPQWLHLTLRLPFQIHSHMKIRLPGMLT